MKTALFAILFFTITSAAPAQTFTIAGTMHHTNLEGGCWYLATADGKQYELFGDTALIHPLHLEGLTTRLSVEHMKGTASICMIGDIVKVVERLDLKRQALDPDIHTLDLKGTMHRTKSGVWYLKTDRNRYEFQQAPAVKYRKDNAPFHQKVSVSIGRTASKERMDGLILTDTPKKKRGALKKIENNDPR